MLSAYAGCMVNPLPSGSVLGSTWLDGFCGKSCGGM